MTSNSTLFAPQPKAGQLLLEFMISRISRTRPQYLLGSTLKCQIANAHVTFALELAARADLRAKTALSLHKRKTRIKRLAAQKLQGNPLSQQMRRALFDQLKKDNQL